MGGPGAVERSVTTTRHDTAGATGVTQFGRQPFPRVVWGRLARHLDITNREHHDVDVRTTLTLDEDVAHRLVELARLSGASFKQVVNQTLRAGLQGTQKPGPALPPFRVTPRAAGFRSGVDVLRLNQLNDELENERLLRQVAGSADRR